MNAASEATQRSRFTVSRLTDVFLASLGAIVVSSTAIVAIAHVDDRFEVSHVSGTWMALAQYANRGVLLSATFRRQPLWWNAIHALGNRAQCRRQPSERRVPRLGKGHLICRCNRTLCLDLCTPPAHLSVVAAFAGARRNDSRYSCGLQCRTRNTRGSRFPRRSSSERSRLS